MIRREIGRQHPIRNVLTTLTLDPTRRPIPARVRVEQQRDHHRRLIRRPSLPVVSIRAIKRAQIHLLHRAQNRPRQMILRQPIPQRRRQQQHLISIRNDEVLTHHTMVLNAPDDTTFPDSLAWKQ
jgi:hypothetical protein